MNKIHELRDYDYDLRVGVWTGDFPSIFRAHNPMRIPNQRHMLINIDTVDKDPLADDLGVISGTGTDLGCDFQGQIGVVSIRSRFSQYYRPELGPNGKPIVVTRQFVGSVPEKGTDYNNYDFFQNFDF